MLEVKIAARQELEDNTAEELEEQHGCCTCHPAASAVDGTETTKVTSLISVRQELIHSRESELTFWILIAGDISGAKLHKVVQS